MYKRKSLKEWGMVMEFRQDISNSKLFLGEKSNYHDLEGFVKKHNIKIQLHSRTQSNESSPTSSCPAFFCPLIYTKSKR